MGVACGVAAVVGMTLSAQTALTSFKRATEFLAGKATHSLRRLSGPMDEGILIRIARDPSVEGLSPLMDRRLRLSRGDLVRILGIDPFLNRVIHPELSTSEVPNEVEKRENAFSFLLDDRAVLVDKGLAEELGLAFGSSIETARGKLQVVGTFPNPSGEPLILMDLPHVQKLYGLQGQVDRVDLILSDEASFRSRWEENFLVQSRAQRSRTFSAMLDAFRLNLEALSLLALFVGVFLIYNTAMFTVVSRRRDTGILRSLGAKRYEILAAFLTEILILGTIGGALGGMIGYFLTYILTGLIGSSISNLYFFLRPGPPLWSAWIVVKGMILGIAAGLLGAAIPLIELVRIEPVKALSGRVAGRGSVRNARKAALAGVSVLAVSYLLFLIPRTHIYVSFLGVFGVVLGVSLLTGMVMVHFHPGLKWGLYRTGKLPGKVAAENIRQNLGRTGVAVAAFMVALSMSIGLGTMIGSFRQSLIWWLGTQIQAEIYIGRLDEAEVPEDFYEELRKMPGIGGVHPYRNVQVFYRDAPIYVSAIDASILQRYTHFGWLKGGNENWEPVKRGGVIVSESFSRRFGVKVGDTIVLQGINGPAGFQVAAVFYDYTTEHGLVMMDRSTFLKIYGDHTINDVGIFMDAGTPFRKEILAEVRRKAEDRGLPVLTRAQLHANVLEVFDATFAITRSMRAIAIMVAFFGIAGALLTLFMDRRREFGIYRALGFSTRQVAKMTLLEGLAMGTEAYLMSMIIGTMVAALLIKVINLRSFNWTIFFRPSLEPYLLTAITAVLASIGAAVFPIWKVCTTYPQMQIREE